MKKKKTEIKLKFAEKKLTTGFFIDFMFCVKYTFTPYMLTCKFKVDRLAVLELLFLKIHIYQKLIIELITHKK